jgi:hypothetical protein
MRPERTRPKSCHHPVHSHRQTTPALCPLSSYLRDSVSGTGREPFGSRRLLFGFQAFDSVQPPERRPAARPVPRPARDYRRLLPGARRIPCSRCSVAFSVTQLSRNRLRNLAPRLPVPPHFQAVPPWHAREIAPPAPPVLRIAQLIADERLIRSCTGAARVRQRMSGTNGFHVEMHTGSAITSARALVRARTSVDMGAQRSVCHNGTPRGVSVQSGRPGPWPHVMRTAGHAHHHRLPTRHGARPPPAAVGACAARS